MANNLLQKGHKLVVYDIAEAAVSQAVSAGAVKATSPAEVRVYDVEIKLPFLTTFFVLQVAKQANTIVTMLPAGSHVLECYKGENGIFRYVRFL